MQSYLIALGAADPASSGSRFANPDGILSWPSVATTSECIAPHDMTISHVHLDVKAAPGAGRSWTLIMTKDGVDQTGGTDISVVLSGSGVTSASDDTHSMFVPAGHTFGYKITAAGTPTLPGGWCITAMQDSGSTFHAQAMMQVHTSVSTANFLGPCMNNYTTENSVYAPIPFAASVKNLYAAIDTAAGTGNGFGFTVRKIGSAPSGDTTLTCNVQDAATTGNDLTHTDSSIVAGDLLSVHVTLIGTPPASRIQVSFSLVPATNGDCVMFQSHSNTATAGQFSGVHLCTTSYLGTEGVIYPQMVAQAMNVKGLTAKLISAPTGTNAWDIALRKGGVDTGAAVIVTGSALTGSVSGLSVSITNGDLLTLGFLASSGTPTSTRIMTGVWYTLLGGVTKTVTPSNANSKVTVTAAPTVKRTVAPASANSKVTVSASVKVRRALKPAANVNGRVTVTVAPGGFGARRRAVPSTVLSTVTVSVTRVGAKRRVLPATVQSKATVNVTRVAVRRRVAPSAVNSKVTVSAALRVITPVLPAAVNSRVTVSVLIGVRRFVRLPARLQIATLLRRRGVFARATVTASIVRRARIQPLSCRSSVTVTATIVRSGKLQPKVINSKVTVSAAVAVRRRLPANFVNSRVTVSATLTKIAPKPLTATQVRWGANIDLAPFSTTAWDQFEAHAGKTISVEHFGYGTDVPLTHDFNYHVDMMQRIIDRGAIPLIDVGTWGVSLASVAAGTYDAQWTTFFSQAAVWGRPFWLRLNWEMNGNWFDWGTASGNPFGNSTTDFVNAWRRLHNLAVAAGANNIRWVWCPNVDYAGASSIAACYPGDAYVDWTGMDGYNMTTNSADWKTFDQVFSVTYRLIRLINRTKPMMIAEVGSREPQGGDVTHSKATWISDMFASLPTTFPKVRALVWFNKTGTGANDHWEIESSPGAQAAFAAGIADKRYTPANVATNAEDPPGVFFTGTVSVGTFASFGAKPVIPKVGRQLGVILQFSPTWPAQLDAYAAMIGDMPNLYSWFSNFANSFPSVATMTQMSSRGCIPIVTIEPWDGGSPTDPTYKLTNITAGNFDTWLQAGADQAAAYALPLYVRFAPEMNGNWAPWCVGVNGNTAADFIAAWNHVRALFISRGATNVKWVWAPNVFAPGGTAVDFTPFYPGSANVDVLGLDGYNFGVLDIWQTWSQVFGGSYDAITLLDASMPVFITETSSNENGGNKAAWITSAFTVEIPTRTPRVTTVMWFNIDKRPGEADWRVESSTASLAAFRDVANSGPWSGTSAVISTVTVNVTAVQRFGAKAVVPAQIRPKTTVSATIVKKPPKAVVPAQVRPKTMVVAVIGKAGAPPPTSTTGAVKIVIGLDPLSGFRYGGRLVRR